MIDEKELKNVRLRIDDLRDFWSKWGYTEVEDMPIYMQDLCKLLEFVDFLMKPKPEPEVPKDEDELDGRP